MPQHLGGTGYNSLDQLKNALGISNISKIITGYYVGNQRNYDPGLQYGQSQNITVSQTINIGFRPKSVIVYINPSISMDTQNIYAGSAGIPYMVFDGFPWPTVQLYTTVDGTVITESQFEIVNNGFRVSMATTAYAHNYGVSYRVYTPGYNAEGKTYCYMALA